MLSASTSHRPPKVSSAVPGCSFCVRGNKSCGTTQVNGNIIKMDRHKYVKLAFHGFRELSAEERMRLYGAPCTACTAPVLTALAWPGLAWPPAAEAAGGRWDVRVT